MVRHQPLQYYEPQLCLSCLTGIYGCRWKRYQRSHDDTTPVRVPVMGPGAEESEGLVVCVVLDRSMIHPGFSFFLGKIDPQ